MRQGARRRKWIGLALVIVLCLLGVHGAGTVEDIPVYTSFSCAREVCRAADFPEAERAQSAAGPEYGSGVFIPRIRQNVSIWLPDVMEHSARIQQSHNVLLRQERLGRRGSHRYAGEADGGAEEKFRQTVWNCYAHDTVDEAIFPCWSRIILFIHDQDGQKDNIL